MNQQAILINHFLNDVFPTGGKVRSVKTSSGSFLDLMKSASRVSGQVQAAGTVSGEVSLNGLKASLLSGQEEAGLPKGQRWIEQLRKLVLAQGIHPDQVNVDAQNLEDMKQILLNIGFDGNEVAGLMAELQSEADSNQLSLTQLFIRIEQLGEPVKAGTGYKMEISALPFIESILSGLGLDADDINDVLSGATNESSGIDLDCLADNLKAKIDQLPELGQSLPDDTIQNSICDLMAQIGLADMAAAGSGISLEKLAELLSARAGQSSRDHAQLLSRNGLEQVRRFVEHLEPLPSVTEQLSMQGAVGVRSDSNMDLAQFLVSNGSVWHRNSVNIQSLEILEQFLNDAGYDPARVSEVIDKLKTMPGSSSISLSRVLAQLKANTPGESVDGGGGGSERIPAGLSAKSSEYRHDQGGFAQLMTDDLPLTERDSIVRKGASAADSEPVHEIRRSSGPVSVRPSERQVFGTAGENSGREIAQFTEKGIDMTRPTDRFMMKGLEELTRAPLSDRSLIGSNSGHFRGKHSNSYKQAEAGITQSGKEHLKVQPGETGSVADRAGMDSARQKAWNLTGSHTGKPQTEAKTDTQDGFAVESLARQRTISSKASETMPQKSADSPVPAHVLNQVNKRMMIMQQAGKTQMEFQLNPPYLGRLNLKVHQTEEGIRVMIVTEKSAARDLLMSHSGELKTAFLDQNIQLDRIEVTVSHDYNQTLADAGNNSERHFPGRQAKHEKGTDMPAPEEPSAETFEDVHSQAGMIHLVA